MDHHNTNSTTEKSRHPNEFNGVFVSVTPDCDVNEGGYFCQVYLDEDMELEFDQFCIHADEFRRIPDLSRWITFNTEPFKDLAIICERDYKGEYERFALTFKEFEKEFGAEVARTISLPDLGWNSYTLQPLVHLSFRTAYIGSKEWNDFFTDMSLNLPESDIESGNLAYVREDFMRSLKDRLPVATSPSREEDEPHVKETPELRALRADLSNLRHELKGIAGFSDEAELAPYLEKRIFIRETQIFCALEGLEVDEEKLEAFVMADDFEEKLDRTASAEDLLYNYGLLARPAELKDEVRQTAVKFSDVLSVPYAGDVDAYFAERGWELQCWSGGSSDGYQVFFGKGVQVDNNFEYGFPHLYDHEDLSSFAKKFYATKVLSKAVTSQDLSGILEDCHIFRIATEYKDVPSWIAGEGIDKVASEILVGWSVDGSIKGNGLHALLDANIHKDNEELHDLIVAVISDPALHSTEPKKLSLDSQISSVSRPPMSDRKPSQFPEPER